MVGLLCLAHFAGYADRAVPAVYAPELKLAFQLSDAQLGALQGLPFVISYVLATLWAGRQRKSLPRPGRWLGLSVLTWTLAGALFAVAPSYEALLGARVLFGFGQAAFAPMALVLLAQARPVLGVQPIGAFTSGSAAGRSGGLLLGGALLAIVTGLGISDVIAPWRLAAMVMLVPNILLAAALFSSRVPVAGTVGRQPGVVQAARWALRRGAVFAPHILAAGGRVMIVQSLGAWAPSIMARGFDLATATAGLLVGLAVLVGAPVGHLGAGWLAARPGFAARGPAMLLVAGAILSALAAAGLAAAPSLWLAVAALTVLIMASGGGAAIALISLQPITPEPLTRGMNALFLVCVTVLGTALGPLVTGLVSDRLIGSDGSLTIALLIVVSGAASVVVVAASLGGAAWRRDATLSVRSRT